MRDNRFREVRAPPPSRHRERELFLRPRRQVGGKQYSQLKADTCCCASCRDLGFVGYELLRQILRDILAPTSLLAKKLLAAVDEEERYRAGEFLTHLKEEDPCASHCLRHTLSSYNNTAYRCDCTHVRANGRVLLELGL